VASAALALWAPPVVMAEPVERPIPVQEPLVAMAASAEIQVLKGSLAVMAVMAVMVAPVLPTVSTVVMAVLVVLAEPMAPPVVPVPNQRSAAKAEPVVPAITQRMPPLVTTVMRAALVDQLVTAALERTAVLVALVERVTHPVTVVSDPMAAKVALVEIQARALVATAVMAAMAALALATDLMVVMARLVVMAEPMAPPVVRVP